MPEFGERLLWYALTAIAIGVTALLTPQITSAQRGIGWAFTALGICTIFYIEWGGILSLLRSSYLFFGAPYPRLSLVLVSLLGAIIFGGSWWLISQLETIPHETIKKQPQSTSDTHTPIKFPASIRVLYSSRQVLQMSNIPGDYNTTLNLDNVAALRLIGPFNLNEVTLLYITSPQITVAEPRAGEKYKIPSTTATTVEIGGAPGLEIKGLTFMGGQAQEIGFNVEHPIRLIRVGDRIFRVSLESVHDKADAKRQMFFEYEFAISEEQPSAEHRNLAISLGT